MGPPCGKGDRDGLAAQTMSASESQVGSRRLLGASHAAERAPARHLGPGCASPAGPMQLGVAAPDAASRMDGRLPWLGSVHTAFRLLAWGPTGEIFLPRVGQGVTSGGQWPPQAPCSESCIPWHLFLL